MMATNMLADAAVEMFERDILLAERFLASKTMKAIMFAMKMTEKRRR